MKTNRRDFIRLAGIAGVGLAGTNLIKSCSSETVEQGGTQQFNMCGYAAPKLETVRIGFIGLGQRGPGAVGRRSGAQCPQDVPGPGKDPAACHLWRR